MEEIDYIDGIIINIYESKDKDTDALIKVMTHKSIIYLIAKGFFNQFSKNRPNIIIGGISSFEILNAYGNKNKKLLKKANIINEFDVVNKQNFEVYKQIIKTLQLLEVSDAKLFETYKLFLQQNEYSYSWQLLTFILNVVLKTKGQQLHINRCTVCSINKNLYCFNAIEGGMFCYEHKVDNSIIDLQTLKFITCLEKSFNEYKKVPHNINFSIYNELLKIIHY